MSDLYALLQKCKELAKRTKALRPNQWQVRNDFREVVPSRVISDELTSLYFRTFESTYRILHTPSFQNDYEQFWKDPKSAEDGFVIVMLLVMAIGTCFFNNSEGENRLRSNALLWIYTAQTWLSAPIQKGRLSIVGLQVHCLLLLARQTNFVGPDLVWIAVGALTRTAIYMGLHRDPTNYPKMSVFDTEIRRKLWATILELAIQTSLDFSMPPLISLDDFDTLPPSNIDDSQISPTTDVPPLSSSEHVFTQSSLQNNLIKSSHLRLKVARLMNLFSSNPTYDEILGLSSEVFDAVRESAAKMQFYQSSAVGHKPSGFHRDLSQHFLRRFILALHLPYSMKAQKDPRLYFSRKVCLEQALHSASPQMDSDFSRLIASGGGMFREILKNGALHLCLEAITQLQEDEENMTLAENKRQREPIREAIERIILLGKERLRMGDTNIKGLLFLGMAMGQIRAMEAGTSPDEGILSAAMHTAVEGYDIMKAQFPSKATLDIDTGIEFQQEGVREELTDAMGQGLGMEALLNDTTLNFNIEDTTSWLFPPFEEVPWGSLVPDSMNAWMLIMPEAKNRV